MLETTISVMPVHGGWAVRPDHHEATHFLNGGRAEAHARRLGEAAWRTGSAALVRVHDLHGRIVAAWRFGPEADGALWWPKARAADPKRD
ncbi:MAG: hypothetical protein ACHP84_17710 [Caulobacterales bacterium]